MVRVLVVGIGGFIGASLRYITSLIFSRIFEGKFPYSTLFVNVVGAVLIGFVMELSTSSEYFSPQLKLFLTTGIMGGLTTFSTFSYETVSLFSSGMYLLCAFNIALNVVLSLGGVFLGLYLAQMV